MRKVIFKIDDKEYFRRDLKRQNCIGSQAEERVIVLKPRNIEDIEVINAYGRIIDNYTGLLTQDDIGKLLMIHTGYDEDWFMIYYMDKYLKEINNKFDNFKEQINQLEG